MKEGVDGKREGGGEEGHEEGEEGVETGKQGGGREERAVGGRRQGADGQEVRGCPRVLPLHQTEGKRMSCPSATLAHALAERTNHPALETWKQFGEESDFPRAMGGASGR